MGRLSPESILKIYMIDTRGMHGDAPTSGLSILHKIKLEHIKLTSYSKMRVNLAAQVVIAIVIIITMYSACIIIGIEQYYWRSFVV